MAPENTLTCIETGLSCSNVSMVEVDVHLTKDGEVIVMHDPTVNRMTDGTGRVENMTLSELKALHVVDENNRIPTLREVLNLIGDRAEVLLEIKRPDNRDDGLEKACLDIIKECGAYGRVTVQSFNEIVLNRFHSMDPEIRLEKLQILRPFNLKKVAQQNHIASYNIFRLGFVSRRFVDKMHSIGKEVKVWTLQSPKQHYAANIDGIITDRPDLF